MIRKPFVRQTGQTWLILEVNKNFKRPKTYYNYKTDYAMICINRLYNVLKNVLCEKDEKVPNSQKIRVPKRRFLEFLKGLINQNGLL